MWSDADNNMRRVPMPWAQGVGRSNRPAPTNEIEMMQVFPGCPKMPL